MLLISQSIPNMSRCPGAFRTPCVPLLRKCGKVPGRVLSPPPRPNIPVCRRSACRSHAPSARTIAPRLLPLRSDPPSDITPSVVTVKGVLIPGTHSWQLFRSAPTPSRQRSRSSPAGRESDRAKANVLNSRIC